MELFIYCENTLLHSLFANQGPVRHSFSSIYILHKSENDTHVFKLKIAFILYFRNK